MVVFSGLSLNSSLVTFSLTKEQATNSYNITFSGLSLPKEFFLFVYPKLFIFICFIPSALCPSSLDLLIHALPLPSFLSLGLSDPPPFSSGLQWVTFSFLFFFFYNSYWSVVDLQCCVSFRCTAKWISYTYTYIHSFLDSFPI